MDASVVSQQLAAAGVRVPVYVPELFKRMCPADSRADDTGPRMKIELKPDPNVDYSRFVELHGLSGRSEELRKEYGLDKTDLEKINGEISCMRFGSEAWCPLIITPMGNRAKLRAHPKFSAAMLNQPESLPFRVANIPGKGTGLVAMLDIPFDLSYCFERPLIIGSVLNSALFVQQYDQLLESAMHPRLLREFDLLNNCKIHNPTGTSRRNSIFRTNAILTMLPFCRIPHGGVFQYTSRINHSYDPNTGYDWDYDRFQLVLYAHRPILKGEEITVAYIDHNQPRAARRAELKEMFDFDCACEKCSL